MIVRVVRLRLRPSKVQDFENVFKENRRAIEAQSGCHGVELLRDAEDEHVRGTLSRWESQDHLDAYRRSVLFGEVWPLTKTFFEAPAEVWSYEVDEPT